MLLTVERDKLDDAICKIAIIRDITENRYKDSLLETVSNVSGILLEPDISLFENNLSIAMGMMAKAVNVGRVHIWRNHSINENLYCTQAYEWSDGTVRRQNSEHTVNISYNDFLIGFEERLSSGYCINGTAESVSPKIKTYLDTQGILSFILVPIIIHDHF